jgi:hypothetical protein
MIPQQQNRRNDTDREGGISARISGQCVETEKDRRGTVQQLGGEGRLAGIESCHSRPYAKHRLQQGPAAFLASSLLVSSVLTNGALSHKSLRLET